MVAYDKDGQTTHESKRLDHLGLVAGMYKVRWSPFPV